LAGLLLSQSQGAQLDPSIIDKGRMALESIYAQAGFSEPQVTRQALETQLTGRLFEPGQAVQTGIA